MADEGTGAPAPAAPTSAASLMSSGGDPAPAPQGDPAPAPSSDAPWYGGAHEDHNAFFQNKNFENLDAFAKSYKNLEGMRGIPENELLRIPKSEDADGMNEFYNRMGRPEAPEGYGFEGVEGADWFRQVAHESGLNESQAMKVIAGYNTQLQTVGETADADYQIQTDKAMAELKSEWGAEHAANSEFAQNAARKFGVTDEELSGMEKSMGTKALMNMMARIGRGTSEGSMAEGGEGDPTSGDIGNTPKVAQEKLTELLADPDWKKRYFSTDKRIREHAMKQRSDLSALATATGE